MLIQITVRTHALFEGGGYMSPPTAHQQFRMSVPDNQQATSVAEIVSKMLNNCIKSRKELLTVDNSYNPDNAFLILSVVEIFGGTDDVTGNLRDAEPDTGGTIRILSTDTLGNPDIGLQTDWLVRLSTREYWDLHKIDPR